MRLIASSLYLIGSWWTAVTFAWLALTLFAGTQGERRTDFLGLTALWSLLLLPVVILSWYLGDWAAGGLTIGLWLLVVVHAAVSMVPSIKPRPAYSRALAKLQFDKHAEAEWEILKQLEKCQDDFEGWMMLAELYARHFRDLPAAAQTVHELCEQPNLHGGEIAVALNRLADWHLNLGDNPAAARAALEKICQRFPGTHVARMARDRIDRLPTTREELFRRRQPGPIPLVPTASATDSPEQKPGPELTRDEAAAQANQCVHKLQADPDNVAAREQFARLLANPLGEVDLALEQLDLLLSMPDQPLRKRAEWLSLMAGWHLNLRQDAGAARLLLQRLLHECPQSIEAFEAQRRLSLIERDQRATQPATAKRAPKPGLHEGR